MLTTDFFARDARIIAQELLGKVLYAKHQKSWLSAMIIETEAYYLKNDKASHSSLGYTEKRRALFMLPGTIYMYYSRAGDSMNVSVGNEGDAVLIKSAWPLKNIKIMQRLNPAKNGQIRPREKLCSGQALLCKSLGLTVKKWDQQQFDRKLFYIADIGYKPEKIIQATRLGIAPDRDEHLPYRFVDYAKAQYCTRKPF